MFLNMKNTLTLPSPSSISYWWNFGSLLGLCLSLQIITGLFLAMQFTADANISFMSVMRILQDVKYGWCLRMMHANGASMFFVCLYLHIGRGIYYFSFSLFHTWSVGVTIFLLTMASAFLGYVLPWGQMSFWGASVITGLIQAIPYIGGDIMKWLWGGFSVDTPTLVRFFSFHFLIPFIVVLFSLIHLMFLHYSGSGNPLGVAFNLDKIEFHSKFSSKDLLGVLFMMFIFFSVVFLIPWDLGDPENFNLANPMMAPLHIQPEWYFLFAYSILRSIPSKLGGVIALAFSVMVLYLFPLFDLSLYRSNLVFSLNKIIFWVLVGEVYILTWIGARPVEQPYLLTGQVFTVLYFLVFFMWSSFYLVTPLNK